MSPLPVLLLATGLLLPAGCSSGRQPPRVSQAPDFTLESLDGRTVGLSDFEGEVLLIDFWATWCGPCRMSIPHLKDLYAKYRGRGFEIVGVAVGDRESSVRQFVEQVGIDYVICMQSETIVGDFGSFSSIPTAFLVDREGRIRARFTGYQTKSTLEQAILPLLES